MSVTAPELDTMERTAPHVSHVTPSVQSKIHYNAVMLMILKFSLFLCLAELSTWIKSNLKPSPNTVHYLLTHYKWIWDLINNISFLRNTLMRYVLTCMPNYIFWVNEYNLFCIFSNKCNMLQIKFLEKDGLLCQLFKKVCSIILHSVPFCGLQLLFCQATLYFHLNLSFC